MERKLNKVRRNVVRIRIWGGVKADVAISEINGMAVDTKSASVLIQDISPEGMQFLTYLRFPVSQDYRIRINLSFGEWQFSLAGHVNWRRLDENQYLHGCEFTPDPGIRRALSAALKEKLRLMIPEQQRIYELYRRVLDASQETAASVIDKRQ